MYDAIVVGARCAGSSTALLLAKRGYKVLVVDRASFPSDTVSTHWLHEPGVAKLAEWHLLDAVLATGCPPIRTISIDQGTLVLHGSPPPMGDIDFALAPRRTVLDKILVEAAADASAEVREGFPAHELLWEEGRVVGIRGGEGAGVTERAPIVIGADGMHSLVARSVGAAEYHARPSLSCVYYAYWSDLPTDGVEAFFRPGHGGAFIPTNDGLTCIVSAWRAERFAEVRRDVEGSFLAALDEVPRLAGRARAATRVTRFAGKGDLPNFYRTPYGPGWALIGDAGYHKDPVTAHGISDAFRDAALLTAAVDEGLSGQTDLGEALAGYEATRNRASLPLYERTCQMASGDPPPEHLERLFAAIPADQRNVDRWVGVIAGTVPVEEFFAPESVAAIMRSAAGMAARGAA